MMSKEGRTENPLGKMMNPQSIAVAGASNSFMKMGTIQFLNIVYSGYSGEVFLIHPKEEEIFGRRVYGSVSELPHAPELAILSVGHIATPGLLEEFGELGTRHAVICSAGYKETGNKGAALEEKLNRLAEQYGMRFLGPNCMGFINAHLPLNITVTPLKTPPGHLGIISQSGTFIGQIHCYFSQRGIRISKAISVGNEANVDIVDCLEYLEQDDQTKAIGLYLESVRRVRPFLETSRRVSLRKPIVAQYVGGTPAGAQAARTHTGAIAGQELVYDGLLEQAGIIRLNTIEEVFVFGHTLAVQPRLKGRKIAILTNSGGPATAMADGCEKSGLEVPRFSNELREALKAHLPEYGCSNNPVDLTFQPDMKSITSVLPRILLRSEEVDGLLIHGIIVTGWGQLVYPLLRQVKDISLEEFLEALSVDLGDLVKMPWEYGKPVCMSSFHGREDRAVVEFHEFGIPTFDSPERAAKAMGVLYKYHLRTKKKRDEPEPLPPVPEPALKVLESTGRSGIDEYWAKKILRIYGIQTCKEIRTKDSNEAVDAAHEIGFPVVVKACGVGISHKTERKLVHLNVMDDAAVKEAFQSIHRVVPGQSVLVCEMIKGERELMAGMKRFPGFPPCILFGLGGILAEVLSQQRIRFAPLSRSDALSLLEYSPLTEILGNYRGMKPADKEALSSLLIRLGHLGLHFPQIREIDLNPIIVDKNQPKVVDALFVF